MNGELAQVHSGGLEFLHIFQTECEAFDNNTLFAHISLVFSDCEAFDNNTSGKYVEIPWRYTSNKQKCKAKVRTDFTHSERVSFFSRFAPCPANPRRMHIPYL
jgi:hypothetical protein